MISSHVAVLSIMCNQSLLPDWFRHSTHLLFLFWAMTSACTSGSTPFVDHASLDGPIMSIQSQICGLWFIPRLLTKGKGACVGSVLDQRSDIWNCGMNTSWRLTHALFNLRWPAFPLEWGFEDLIQGQPVGGRKIRSDQATAVTRGIPWFLKWCRPYYGARPAANEFPRFNESPCFHVRKHITALHCDVEAQVESHGPHDAPCSGI